MRSSLLFKKVSLVFTLVTLSVGAVHVHGQQTDSTRAQRPRQVFPKDEQPEEVLKVDTDLVSLDVLASDAEGRPVKNLRQADFKVFVDGVEQPLSFFQVERRSGQPRPVSVVFALDISGSMTPEEME